MNPADNNDKAAPARPSGQWLVRTAVALLGTGILVALLLIRMALWLRVGVMLAVAVAVIVVLSGA